MIRNFYVNGLWHVVDINGVFNVQTSIYNTLALFK